MKLAWTDRGSDVSVAGLGMAAGVVARPGESPQSVIERCRSRLQGHPQLRFYGGFAFRRERSLTAPEWQPFGSALFWIPRLTFDGQRLRLVVLDEADINSARRAVTALRPSEPMPAWDCPACLERVDLPERSRWLAHVHKVLGLLRDEILEKVVLARRATFRFGEPPCPWALTEKLSYGNPSCYRFCLQVRPQSVFLGATPERLFLREGRRLQTEVVAGTRRRGDDPAEDDRLARELRRARKSSSNTTSFARASGSDCIRASRTCRSTHTRRYCNCRGSSICIPTCRACSAPT